MAAIDWGGGIESRPKPTKWSPQENIIAMFITSHLIVCCPFQLDLRREPKGWLKIDKKVNPSQIQRRYPKWCWARYRETWWEHEKENKNKRKENSKGVWHGCFIFVWVKELSRISVFWHHWETSSSQPFPVSVYGTKMMIIMTTPTTIF